MSGKSRKKSGNSLARRASRTLLAAVLVAPAVLVSSPTAQAASSEARALPGRFYSDGVNIRNAPRLNATVRGLGYRSHRITVHCGTPGPLETYWWRITNNTTGVRGYIVQEHGGPSSDPGRC
ncbi:SH3 domain-containing protein [Streptomyces sp. NPDC002490]|uniref:SH3 domain-containing protein n=1 Tax=Streptomyces sp. NPDC002490 TaxID=3154416 RepID=UPI003328847C